MSEIRDGNVDIIPGRGYAHKWRQSYPRQIDPVLFIFRGVYSHNYLYAHNKRGAAAGGGTWFHGIFWWPLNSMTTAPWMDARLGCHCPAAILIPHYPPKFSCGWIISQRPLFTFAVYRSRSSLGVQATRCYILHNPIHFWMATDFR